MEATTTVRMIKFLGKAFIFLALAVYAVRVALTISHTL